MSLRCLPLLLLATSLMAADPPASDVACLTAEEARAAIVDESVEPYFSLLQTREMSAKTGSAITGDTLDAQRDACRERYRAAVGEFSDPERAALTRIVGEVRPFLAARYPVFAAEPWRFIKLSAALEGGMPFTRGRCIVLSDEILHELTELAGDDPGHEAEALLVHEQTHVVQRLHPRLFAPLYTEAWGFVRLATAPAMLKELAARQLVNPDGVACVWAYDIGVDGHEELIQPLAVLAVGDAEPSLERDLTTSAFTLAGQGDAVSYLLDGDGRPRERPLDEVVAYADAFAPSEENFHPNEICAELFATMVVGDLSGHAASDETPCQKALRAWATAYLGASDPTAVPVPLERMAPPPPRKAGEPIPPGPGEQWYALQANETLMAVAHRFNVDLAWIIKRNDIEDEAVVKPGLKLVVPRPAAPAPP